MQYMRIFREKGEDFNRFWASISTEKTDKDGKVVYTAHQFNQSVKYTLRMRIEDDDPWKTLAHKSTWVFLDSIPQKMMDAIWELEERGAINSTTRLAATGHLVYTPGKPSLDDLYNLKTMFIVPAEEDVSVPDLKDALTKEEWHAIYSAKRSGRTSAEAPVAPTAPVAPSAPF